MANIKSQIKRVKTNEKRRQRNKWSARPSHGVPPASVRPSSTN